VRIEDTGKTLRKIQYPKIIKPRQIFSKRCAEVFYYVVFASIQCFKETGAK